MNKRQKNVMGTKNQDLNEIREEKMNPFMNKLNRVGLFFF
jgi:hypothetical protein